MICRTEPPEKTDWLNHASIKPFGENELRDKRKHYGRLSVPFFSPILANEYSQGSYLLCYNRIRDKEGSRESWECIKRNKYAFSKPNIY